MDINSLQKVLETYTAALNDAEGQEELQEWVTYLHEQIANVQTNIESNK